MRLREDAFPLPPAQDLRKLSRNARRITTVVMIDLGYAGKFAWLKLGEIQFREHSGNRQGSWQLGAYLVNATDFEHDSAWLLKMELIGVRFTSVEYGITTFDGWIRGDEIDSFRVPPVKYDALKLATTCKSCKGEDAHQIVPEGYYVPPADPELYQLLRGRRIEVSTGCFPKEG